MRYKYFLMKYTKGFYEENRIKIENHIPWVQTDMTILKICKILRINHF